MWQPMHGKGLAQYRRKGDGDAWRGRQGRADYSRPRARAGQSHHHGQGGRRCGRSDQRLRACIQILQMRTINTGVSQLRGYAQAGRGAVPPTRTRWVRWPACSARRLAPQREQRHTDDEALCHAGDREWVVLQQL